MKRKLAQLDSISNSASATQLSELPQPSVAKTNSSSSGGVGAGPGPELSDSDVILPSVLHFKRSQLSDRYPKGHSRGRHWKHLKQIIQAENYHLYPPDEPNSSMMGARLHIDKEYTLAPYGFPTKYDISIEAPPSMYPAKKYCDITGFEAPYTDPRTKVRYANAEVFKRIRSMPDEFIQGYLALRNAAVILK